MARIPKRKKKLTKTRKLTNAAFKEVNEVTPKAVMHTMATKGKAAAEKQRVAIALSKARAKGARIPKRKS